MDEYSTFDRLQPSIPHGYTFLNRKTFISQKAKDYLWGMLKKADDCNLDVHDMYIYGSMYNSNPLPSHSQMILSFSSGP